MAHTSKKHCVSKREVSESASDSICAKMLLHPASLNGLANKSTNSQIVPLISSADGVRTPCGEKGLSVLESARRTERSGENSTYVHHCPRVENCRQRRQENNSCTPQGLGRLTRRFANPSVDRAITHDSMSPGIE